MCKEVNKHSEIIKNHFIEHQKILYETSNKYTNQINNIAIEISKTLLNKGTIFFCGNGGSASDSQHLVAEFIGRFKEDRSPLRAVSLTSDTSVLTCISNDFNYENVFSRQIEALGKKNDTLIALSTSGNSKNIEKVLKQAKANQLKTIAFLGKSGGVAKEIADYSLIIPSSSTARIQEMHILIGHILCDLVEKELGF